MKKTKWLVCIVCVLTLTGMTACSKTTDDEIVPTSEPKKVTEETVLSEEEQVPGNEQVAEEEQVASTESDEEQEESNTLTEADETDWFAAYNGEKLHRVTAESPESYSPAVCSDIIFYEAEDGESMEEILYKMIDAMIQPLTEESEDRSFTVTAYRLEEQAYEVYDEAIADVWLLPYLNGYYSYTGVDFVSMESIMQEQPELAQDGMVPFQRQGSEEAFVFVLMKEGNVYRLQRAQDMKEVYLQE